MMAVEARPASTGSARLSPEPELKHEPRTLAARKAYPREPSPDHDMEYKDDRASPASPKLATYEDMKRYEDAKQEPMHLDVKYEESKPQDYKVPKPCKEEPLDLSVRKVSVRDFARHPFNEAIDFVRAQLIRSQSQGFLARDSGTDSDDSAGRFSPGDETGQGKAYKKSLIKRYSKCFCSWFI
ncbi:Transcription factor E74 isoform B [Operophtera brumata]|uniref:Transcription factor E74 isoform B n=1 Tax=Operophtera brumata TaxID=104452 RepID=A0A0L7LCH5_OPEBR|nr:Transcription factor E74 isoform B [Operophtera brumata]